MYDVEWVQEALKQLGYYNGHVDGISGPKTREAIIAFKRDNGLRPRYFVGPATLLRLQQATKKPTPARARTREIPWINEINKVMNMHESRDNKPLSDWLREGTAFLGDPSKLAWCGDAVETAIGRTLVDEPIPQNPFWARNWARFGVECGEVYGAIAVFKRGKGGHVGFLVGLTANGKKLRIRGGNQQNAVNDTWLSSDRLLALRWPATYPVKFQRAAPILDDDGAPVSTNEA